MTDGPLEPKDALEDWLDRYDVPVNAPSRVNHKRVRCSCGTWMMARYTLVDWSALVPVEFVCPSCNAVVPYGRDSV